MSFPLSLRASKKRAVWVLDFGRWKHGIGLQYRELGVSPFGMDVRAGVLGGVDSMVQNGKRNLGG